MKWTKILKYALPAAAAVLLILLLSASVFNFPFKIDFVKTTLVFQPTMLQVKELRDITELTSACYIGEVIVSYRQLEEAKIQEVKDEDIGVIIAITCDSKYDYKYLNETCADFLKRLGMTPDTPYNVVMENLNGWKINLLKKRLSTNSARNPEIYINCFNKITERIRDFTYTYNEYKEKNRVDPRKFGIVKYNLDMLGIHYYWNMYTLELDDANFRLESVKWIRIAKALLTKEKTTVKEFDAFSRNCSDKERDDFLNIIGEMDRFASSAYFIGLISEKEKKQDKLKLIIDHCALDSGINSQKYRKTVNSADVAALINNPGKLAEFLKKNIYDEPKEVANNVVLLGRGKVFANYDLSHIALYYSSKDYGTLFIIAPLGIKAIVNPFLYFDEKTRVNGFEVISSDSNKDLVMNNSILSVLKKECKEQLMEDAIKDGLKKDAKDSAESSLLGLIQAINAQKPGKVSKVTILQNIDEIDKGKYKPLFTFDQNENDWIEKPLL